MIRSDRVCVHCMKAIPPNARLDTFFCLATKPSTDHRHIRSECHKAWANRRRSAQYHAIWAKEMEKSLSQAHRHAAMYRLAIRIDSTTWFYPDPGRPSPRFDGIERQTPGFRIKPFELPVVPITGRYGVGFCDAAGNPIDSRVVSSVDASLDLSSFEIEPLMVVGWEIGQRYQPLLKKPIASER